MASEKEKIRELEISHFSLYIFFKTQLLTNLKFYSKQKPILEIIKKRKTIMNCKMYIFDFE